MVTGATQSASKVTSGMGGRSARILGVMELGTSEVLEKCDEKGKIVSAKVTWCET